MLKSDIVCDVYTDGKLTKSIPERRVVYTDTKGKYIRCMKNKEYLDNNNHYKFEYRLLGRSQFIFDQKDGIMK